MKNKFIRILSPITIAVIIVLDIATIAYGIFSINKVIQLKNTNSIIFLVIEIFALVVAILVTKEIFTNGVKFHDDKIEFIGIDEENIFKYDEIEKVETYQDTTASLTKNFIDRHSLIIFTLKNDKVTTIDIGLTTKGTLQKIAKEISNFIGSDKVIQSKKTSDLHNLFKKK